MITNCMTASDRSEKSTESDYNINRRNIVAGLGSTIPIGIAGCLGNGNGNGGNGSGGGEAATELDPESPPEKPDEIVVRAWGGVWEGSLDSNVAQTFTEETGIDVVYDNTHESEMRNELVTAIEQDREPSVNVDWTTATDGHRAYRQGVPEPLHPGIVTNQADMRDLAIPDVDEDRIPYLGLFSYTYSLCYNESRLEEIQGNTTPVSSWEELTDEMYENELGVYENGHGIYRMLSALTGVPLDTDPDSDDIEPLWQKLEEFDPSIGMIADDTRLTEGIIEGEIAYACLLSNNLVAPKEEGDPVDWTVPEEGAAVQFDLMYTPRNQSISELYWSQEFINTAADPDVQSGWTEDLALPMLHNDVEPVDWMVDDPAFPTDESQYDELLAMDYDLWAENSPAWIAEFNRIAQ